MVRKFPEFSRFSLIFFKKVPFSRFSRFSLSRTNPALYIQVHSTYSSKAFAKRANIVCQTLLFVSVSLALDN